MANNEHFDGLREPIVEFLCLFLVVRTGCRVLSNACGLSALSSTGGCRVSHCAPPRLVVALTCSLYDRLMARSVLLGFNMAFLKVSYLTESLKGVILGTLWDNCCSQRICDYFFTCSVGMYSHL